MDLLTLLAVLVAQMVALSAIMAGGWWIQQSTRNSGFVDAVWTFGLGSVGAVSAFLPLNGGTTPRQIIVGSIVLAWSLRLGIYILRRSVERGDDPRYAALNRQWGRYASRQMFALLQKQALVGLPMALSIFIAAHNPAPFGRMQDWLGMIVIVTGILGEALADRQLRQWMATRTDPHAVCDRGLWGWSRHPNYFFEWLFWLAFPLFAIDLTGAYPYGWLVLAAPLCMYWLLTHISGIPPLEQHMVAKYGEAYRAYQRRVSAFFPVPKRAGSGAG